MSIKIIKPGVLATLQDGGRYGLRSMGIGSSGAMDIFAMKLANYLCANDEDHAVIEINFPAPEILFQQDAVISLTGADLAATINEKPIPVWRTVFVKKDSLLKFKQSLSGARTYLAVHGGWEAGEWGNSYSTHLKLGVGGHCGRALQKDDSINFSGNQIVFTESKILAWHISQNELNKIYTPGNIIRCIKAAEYDWLDAVSKQNFEQNNFTISNQSDRMGYRLTGNNLLPQQPAALISSAVDAGIVQLLPDGNCIVLMADHQTTGGYPRIAAVIKADLPKLAQLHPGNKILFKTVGVKEAEDALISMQELLAEIRSACRFHLEKYLPH
jgi:antagonist of KipI